MRRNDVAGTETTQTFCGIRRQKRTFHRSKNDVHFPENRDFYGSMKRVALIMNIDFGYCRQALLGVFDYVAGHGGWIHRHSSPHLKVVGALKEWRPDGIIAHVFDIGIAKALVDLKVPLVNTTPIPGFDLPHVTVDTSAAGVMAAEYFLKRGFRSFAFFGNGDPRFSLPREAGFLKRLEQSGYTASVLNLEYLPVALSKQAWRKQEQSAVSWLRSLTKPVAVFAANDVLARDLSDFCHAADLKVPGQVAILGADDDECVCRMANPPLSSIQAPMQAIGYESARRLDILMAGRPLDSMECVLLPTKVVTRASTDIVATGDDAITRALTYIRMRHAEPMSVAAVVKESGISRRLLERKFRSVLQHTILEEIQSVRTHRAKQLLAETQKPLSSIADLCGFTDARRMSLAFKKLEGCSPSDYRKRAK